MLNRLHQIRRWVGVDKPVFYSILSRAFSMAGSLITIPLILTRLTSVEQGFYYTFGSILALQVFLEMGFGAVAIQMVAHEAAHLKIDLASGVAGPAPYLDRFSATVRFIRNWYAVLSLLVGIGLFPVGFWFFSTAARIKKGSGEKLELGRIDIKRDWGWAPEYVEAMWLMMQQNVPDDYIIATGVSTSLQDYVGQVFECLGLNWRDFVTISPGLKRPSDIDISFGHAAKAEKILGWKPKVQLPEIISRMVEAELRS